jgi:hypothetical protein
VNGLACSKGCFECGPRGERAHHIGTGCCGSTLCHPVQWDIQVRDYLRAEQTYQWLWLEAEAWHKWLAAEEEFKAKLRRANKVQMHTYVPREMVPEIDPAKQRAGIKQSEYQHVHD